MIHWERLINKQLATSQLIKQLSKTKSTYLLKPCITISSEPGSGGRIVAKKIAALLKLEVFDKELVDLIATRAKKRRQLIEALDEKTQDNITFLINSYLGFESLPEYTYIKSFTKVVLGIASLRPAIIVGRGANFVLPKETTLRIQTIAPFKTRVKNYVIFEKMSEDKARKRAIRLHLERKQFINKYFNKNVSNANYYDLVLNTRYLEVDQVAAIVVAAFKKRFNV